MRENEVKINDEVYVVRRFGSYKHGFEFQIDKCKVQYKGTVCFIPYGFHGLMEQYQEISYEMSFKTLKEAQEVVKSYYPGDKSIKFIKQYNGAYYDVKVEDSERR